MERQEILSKIVDKKEFSNLPKKDVEKIFGLFEKRQTSDEDKIKLTRDLLRKVYSVFTSSKLLNKKILDKKTSEEILKKHISTRERFNFYVELYERIFSYIEGKEISVVDFGAGINGLSYGFFPKDKKVFYFGIEAVGQLVDLMDYYFKKNKIKTSKVVKGSLFDLGFLKKEIQSTKFPRVLFLFKVLDSLEMVEKNYSKKLIGDISGYFDLIVVSFATRSLVFGKKFNVKRYWFENFVKENFVFLEEFEFGSERYILFKKR